MKASLRLEHSIWNLYDDKIPELLGKAVPGIAELEVRAKACQRTQNPQWPGHHE